MIFQINRDECWQEVAETENLKVELSVRSRGFAEIRPPGCLLSSILGQVRGTRAPPLVPGGRVALLMAAASCVWERNELQSLPGGPLPLCFLQHHGWQPSGKEETRR